MSSRMLLASTIVYLPDGGQFDPSVRAGHKMQPEKQVKSIQESEICKYLSTFKPQSKYISK